MKLDIACGQNKTPGFKGIDLSGNADIVHDLFNTPWPVKTRSVTEAVCNHFVEHIPHYLPQFEGRDGWWVFFDELYRCMKPGGIARFVHPYVMNGRAFWDPTHTRYIHEVSWYYLDKGWRAAQGLDHYPVAADFEVVTIEGVGIADDVATRSDEAQAHMRAHNWNVIADLAVTLKRR